MAKEKKMTGEKRPFAHDAMRLDHEAVCPDEEPEATCTENILMAARLVSAAISRYQAQGTTQTRGAAHA